MASEEGAEQIEVEVMDEVAAAGEEEGGNGMLIVIGGLLCLIVVVVIVVIIVCMMGGGGGAGPCKPANGKCIGKKKELLEGTAGETTTAADVTTACSKKTDEAGCTGLVVEGETCCEFTKEEAKPPEEAK